MASIKNFFFENDFLFYLEIPAIQVIRTSPLNVFVGPLHLPLDFFIQIIHVLTEAAIFIEF